MFKPWRDGEKTKERKDESKVFSNELRQIQAAIIDLNLRVGRGAESESLEEIKKSTQGLDLSFAETTTSPESLSPKEIEKIIAESENPEETREILQTRVQDIEDIKNYYDRIVEMSEASVREVARGKPVLPEDMETAITGSENPTETKELLAGPEKSESLLAEQDRRVAEIEERFRNEAVSLLKGKYDLMQKQLRQLETIRQFLGEHPPAVEANPQAMNEISLLSDQINKGIRFIKKETTILRWRHETLPELLGQETEKLKEFFGYDIEVPPLPEEITPERYEKWKEMGFELHYLPDEKLTEERDLPGWKKKLGYSFYGKIKDQEINADATTLPGAWVLADTREKSQSIGQAYKDDVLAETLKDLRKRELIRDFRIQGSRFNISFNELHKRKVRRAIAETLDVPEKFLRLPRAIEWNFLSNAYYPQWDGGETREILEDTFTKVYQGYQKVHNSLVGASAQHGNGSAVYDYNTNYYGDILGFRPLVVFSRKKFHSARARNIWA